jgi:glucosamine-6-phosphate deaminase
VEVLILGSPAEAARRAAEAVLEGLTAAHRAEPTLGLATGSSPLGLYAELAGAVSDGRLDLRRARGFALDEYVGLGRNHPQTYRQVLLREVCERLGLPPDRLHVPDGSGTDENALMAAAADYERLIREAGGIDVQILGIGANGHLGFNEPGSSLTSRTRVKRLADRTRRDNARFFATAAEVPTHCVTQGLGTILDAGRLVLIATGAAKANAVAAAVEGALSATCPASIIQWHPDATIVLDDAAATGLRNRGYYDASAAGLDGR